MKNTFLFVIRMNLYKYTKLIKVNSCDVDTPSIAVVRLALTKQGYPIIAKY